MTSDDATRLAMYREKRGPLNPMLRADMNAASIASAVFNAAGAKKQGGGEITPSDFMRWTDDEELTPESVMKKLMGGR